VGENPLNGSARLQISDGNLDEDIVCCGTKVSRKTQAMRKIAGALNKSNCIGLFINQVREKIGIMFGNPETTPGRILPFI